MNIYEGLHGHVVYIFWFINIFDVLAVEMYNTFLCFLIATANGPPWGNASGCVQQVPSLANTPNDEKNLRRRETHEREKTLAEFKERGRRTETLSPSLGRMEPDGRIFPANQSWSCLWAGLPGGGAWRSECCNLIGPRGDGLRQSQITVIIFFSLYLVRSVLFFFFFQWIISVPR